MIKQIKSLWQFLGSIRLALILLIVIAVVSLIGIIFPQNLSAEKYLSTLGPFWGKWLIMLGCDQVFSTLWFQLLLTVLSINVFVCSATRFWKDMQGAFTYKFLSSVDQCQKLKYSASFSFSQDKQRIIERIKKYLRHRFYTFSVQKNDSSDSGVEVQLAAKKGKLKYISSFVFHISLILFLLAGLINRLGGYSYHQQLSPGTIVTVKDRTFLLKCEWFEVDKNPQGAIRDFRAKLVLLTNNPDSTIIKQKVIEVNKPLSYQGIRFYQSSYGETGKINDATVTITGPGFASADTTHRLALAQTKELGKSGIVAQMEKYVPDFIIDMQTKKVSTRSLHPHNQAVKILLTKGQDTLYNQWVFQKFPNMFKNSGNAYQVRLNQVSPEYYTGIQIRKYPGVTLIWIGIILMTFSIFVMFYLDKRNLWIFITRQDDSSVVINLGGTSSVRGISFRHEFKSFTQGLKRKIDNG